MAKVIYGIGIERISGRLGGTVYSRNRFGNYLRRLGTPVNPNTVRQVVIKNLMTALTAIWVQTLTKAQRDAWGAYGDAVTVLNSVGEAIHLPGMNHFIRSNIPRMQAGLDRIDDGPTAYALPEIDPTISFAATASDDGLAVTFDNLEAWANEDGAALLVYGGRPRSQSVIFFAGPYRLAGAILGDSVTAPTSPAALTSDFVLSEGQLLTAQFRICLADGRISEPFRFTDTVAA